MKKGIESTWNVASDRTLVALTMTFIDEPMAKNMSFQREYAEPYDWVAQQFKDWAFTLTMAILYYNDYDSIDEDARELYRKFMAAFGGIAPNYHIELLDKPTIYWDFHSLLLGVQMMFSFMLVDDDQPLRLCKHCQKVFLGSRSNAAFCSARCKNQYNVYKSREKSKGGGRTLTRELSLRQDVGFDIPLLPFPVRRILPFVQILISSVAVQNPPTLLPPRSVCPLPICPSCRCRSQPLSSVSRKQRYNTLDFPRESRVPREVLPSFGNLPPRGTLFPSGHPRLSVQ